MRFVIRPGGIELSIRAFDMPDAGWIYAMACRTVNTCPAAQLAKRGTDPPDAEGSVNYTATIPLTATTTSGITRFCAVVNIFNPGPPGLPGTPPGPNSTGRPLECLALDGPLLLAAGAFKIVEERSGLRLQGWAIDVATDNAGAFTIRNGNGASATHVAMMAGRADQQSKPSWPGFSTQHGFDVVVPYYGRAGPSPVCVVLGQGTIRCFDREEQALGFGPAQDVVQGSPIQVGLRNVGPGAEVTVNFQSAGGYFLMPWKHSAVWTSTASAAGAVDLSVDTTYFPPAQYTIAFHCQPECPSGDRPAGDLVGGPEWTGSIHLGQSFTVAAQGSAVLTVNASNWDTLRVTGAGFGSKQPLRLIVIPNAGLFDGPPVKAAPVIYPVADQAGAFTADVTVAGLPLDGTHTQVIAFAADGRPAAATFYSRK